MDDVSVFPVGRQIRHSCLYKLNIKKNIAF